MGGEAVRELLKQWTSSRLQPAAQGHEEATSDAKRKKLAKRLKVVDSFLESGNKRTG